MICQIPTTRVATTKIPNSVGYDFFKMVSTNLVSRLVHNVVYWERVWAALLIIMSIMNSYRLDTGQACRPFVAHPRVGMPQLRER